MNDNQHIDRVISTVESSIGHRLEVDRMGLGAAYSQDRNSHSLTVKVISIIGGILASALFVGSLYIARLDQTVPLLLILALVFFSAAILINKKYDKVILDAVSVSMYALSYLLLAMGLEPLPGISTMEITCVFFALGIVTLLISKSYILTFIAILVCAGSPAILIFELGIPALSHILLIIWTFLFLLLTWNEPRLMSMPSMKNKRYLAMRTGLLFGILYYLYLVSKTDGFEIEWQWNLVSSGFLIIMTMWVINCLLNRFNCDETGKKIFIFTAVTICLGLTAMYPAISGSILLLLLSFKVNYKTGIALSIAAILYFVGMFYYDLNISLLHKSIAMMVSGVFFLLLYFIIFKKPRTHEKA